MTPIPVIVQDWAAYTPGLISKADWQQWANGAPVAAADTQPQVSAIPAMLRRRLSPLGKMALSVVFPLLNESEPVPCVFCSRHGELARTVQLLTSLSDGEPLSPTQFSLSVHNAIGGVLSIARKDHSSITALATDDADISAAVLEAVAIATEQGVKKILCVIYDDEIPEAYLSAGVVAQPPFALAMLLATDAAAGQSFALSLAPLAERPVESAQPDLPPALALLKFMLSTQNRLALPARNHSWQWQKTA